MASSSIGLNGDTVRRRGSKAYPNHRFGKASRRVAGSSSRSPFAVAMVADSWNRSRMSKRDHLTFHRLPAFSLTRDDGACRCRIDRFGAPAPASIRLAFHASRHRIESSQSLRHVGIVRRIIRCAPLSALVFLRIAVKCRSWENQQHDANHSCDSVRSVDKNQDTPITGIMLTATREATDIGGPSPLLWRPPHRTSQ